MFFECFIEIGTVDTQEATNLGFDLTIVMNRFKAMDRRMAEFLLDGQGYLGGSYRSPELTGTFRVSEGQVRAERFMRMRQAVDLTDPMVMALIDTTLVLEQRLFERAQNPFMQNLRMDAEIGIGPNFWMRSQALEVELAGTLDVQMDRALGDLIAFGTLSLARGKYRYVSVRYRARGTVPWGDYLLWLGNGPGGLPDEWTGPVRLDAIRATGVWHTIVAPVGGTFSVESLALEVSSAGEQGDIRIDTIRLSARKPHLQVGDILEVSQGWAAARLPREQAKAVDLSAVANTDPQACVRDLRLASWLPAGEVTVCGVPFILAESERGLILTTGTSMDPPSLPIGTAAREAYLLLGARLPHYDLTGYLRERPVESFFDPERFVFRVEYEDVLQETYARAWKAIAGFRGDDARAIFAWLRTIAERAIVSEAGPNFASY